MTPGAASSQAPERRQMDSPYNKMRTDMMLRAPPSPQTLSMDLSSPPPPPPPAGVQAFPPEVLAEMRAGVQAWDVTDPSGAALILGPPLAPPTLGPTTVAQTARQGRQVRIETPVPLGNASARLAKIEAKNAAATAKLEKQLAKAHAAQAQFRMAHRILDWSAADDPTSGSHGMLASSPWLGFYHHEDVVMNTWQVMKERMINFKWKMFLLMMAQKLRCQIAGHRWGRDARWLAELTGAEMRSCGASLMRSGQIMDSTRGIECYLDTTLTGAQIPKKRR